MGSRADISRLTELRHSRVSWIAGQVFLVALGIVLYFRVRGLTRTSEAVARAHARAVLGLEQALSLDVEHAVQRPVERSEGLATLANWLYIWGHWPVLITVMVWLVWRHRPQFLELRDGMLVSGGLGMIVFVSYPVAPPRLTDGGYVDTVTQRSTAYRYLQPPAFVDQYAAMPSLHVGWDLLAAIAVWGATASVALRLLAAAMPLLMAWAVVATANHFVLDIAAGVFLVLVGHAVALLLARRRRQAQEAPP